MLMRLKISMKMILHYGRNSTRDLEDC